MNQKNSPATSSLPLNAELDFPENQLLRYAQSLSPNEPLFKTLVEMIPVGLTLCSMDRNLAYANKTLANILGYTQEELTGVDWNELTYEADRASNLEIYEKLLSGELNFIALEKRYWHKEGHLIWCRLQMTIIDDKKTGEKLSLAIIEDIQEQKQLAKALERQKAMIQMGEKIAGLGTFIWNVITNEVEASPEVLRILELDPDTTTPQNLFEQATKLVHPEDAERLQEEFRQTIEEKNLKSSEYRIQFPDGRIKWLKTIPGGFLDDQHLLRTVQDITPEVQKSSLLERQKEMIQMGEEVSGIGTFIWDVETFDLEVSKGIYDLFELPVPEHAVKESFDAFFDLIHPEDLDTIKYVLNEVSETRLGKDLLFRIYTPTGKLKWIRSNNGKFLSATRRLTSLQDITLDVEKTRMLEQQKEMIEIGEQVTGLGTFIWNVETREMTASSGLYHLFGFEDRGYDSKLFMDKFLEMIHPDDLEAVESNMKQISEEKNLKPIEFRIRKDCGKELWLRTSPGKFLNDKEKLGTLQDVSEDKRKANQLERQAGMIRVGELTANVGTFVWDIHTHEIYASPGFYKCFGLKEEEIDRSQMFEACWNMVIPEDLHIMESRRKAIEAGEIVGNVDFRIRCPKGKLKWIRNYQGEFLNEHLKLGTVQDITYERQRTEVLERQEEMIRLGEEVGNMGVDIWNLETGEFFYSPHLLSMFQIDPKDVTNTNLLDLLSQRFHPEDQKQIDIFTQKLIENPDRPVEVRHRIILDNGEIRWLHAISARYIHPNTRITINKDITNFIRQKEELLDSQKEMEQLLYTVSHDLRAPLRHVSSYARMVQKSTVEKLDETESRHLSKVISASGRLGTMIDELLQFFRNRNIEMCRVPVDLEKICARTQEFFSVETEKRSIDWQIGPLPRVSGDPQMLEKVMLNLISNAVKFTSKKEDARIEISAKKMGHMAIIQVVDNGAGFKMKYIDKLFAVFQRLHKNSDFEGTGIGLSNVKRIIERHGGSIWAEGEIGQGATFYFTLPLAKEST
ncbi:MAG: PAS domain-containing protein [Bacteroidota bacterium]